MFQRSLLLPSSGPDVEIVSASGTAVIFYQYGATCQKTVIFIFAAMRT
jgi:hypothetical protein